MSKLISVMLVLVTWLAWTSVHAELYKRVDEHGNVTYTDKPAKEKEETFTAPNINTVEGTPPPDTEKLFPKKNQRPVVSASYNVLEITTPSNDSVVRDNLGNVTVQIKLEPKLQDGHTLFLQLDGAKPQAMDGLSHVFNNMDRGTHRLSAMIKNGKGKVIKRAIGTTFHLKRTIAR